MTKARNAIVATGLVVFAAAGLAFPFYMGYVNLSLWCVYCRWLYLIARVRITWFVLSRSSRKPVIDSTKPLPPQATFRGPYINTGSRDVGPDHRTYPKNWLILWRTFSWCT